MALLIPESHKDLLDKPIVVTVATISPDGTPHTAVVWRTYEDGFIFFTSDYGSRKYKVIIPQQQV
jgi:pyridoxine/pyridoxamine 5'-phosphate oxidase